MLFGNLPLHKTDLTSLLELELGFSNQHFVWVIKNIKLQIKICSFGFLTDQNSTNQNIHFRICDKPAPVKYPKIHILIFQNSFIKIRILGYIKLQIEICSFGFLTDQNSKIKTYILGYYLNGYASQISQNAYSDFPKFENPNMHFGNLH